MSEGERRKLKLRLDQARRLATEPLDALTKDRIEALIHDLEQRLAAAARTRDIE
jgi:hypothetical protein